MQSILQNIAKHVSLTSDEEALFLSKTETKHLKAKTILLSSGEIANCTYSVSYTHLDVYKRQEQPIIRQN